MTKLDRLYSLLTAKTGIVRIRDVRLERIAAERALEARYQVGTDGTEAIVHPIDQLVARTFPWQSGAKHVGENATWHYYPPTWVDPIAAAVDATLPDGTKVGWWNSAQHRANLTNLAFTHWGHGIHWVDVGGGKARRWYFITTFAGPMAPLTARFAELAAGHHVGRHLRADGGSIGSRSVDMEADELVHINDRINRPGGGPVLHMTDGPLARLWIDESDAARLVEP